jgi:hypothetical protein
MSANHYITFHNQTRHVIKVQYSDCGCYKSYTPDTIVLAPGDVDTFLLEDDDGGDCNHADKWITWNVIDMNTGLPRWGYGQYGGLVQYKHWKLNGDWTSAVRGPVMWATFWNDRNDPCWGYGHSTAYWSDPLMFDVYL